MALVRYGGGVTQMSGSIGGTTFARNASGNYARSRTKPVNPSSPAQSKMRLILAFLVEYWNEELTPAEREQWATYANAVSMTNRLGESIKVSGFNHFVRGNSPRLLIGKTTIEPGPTVLTLPPTDPTYSVAAHVSTQLISVTFDNTQDWAIAINNFMICYQGRPQVVTRNFFRGPFRYTGFKEGAVVPPTSPFTVTAVFPLILGQRIWVGARIHRSDGRCTIRFTDDTIVAA